MKRKKKSNYSSIWETLAEVDDLMQHVSSWKKIDWSNLTSRQNFIRKKLIEMENKNKIIIKR